MTFISYAQNGEDVILRRVFSNKEAGFYIDVGACWPEIGSVTKGLYDLGWHGINIEPHPTAFSELQARRPRDINLNIAISSADSRLVLHEGPSVGETSTARSSPGTCFEVDAWTLRRVCETYVHGDIDFLKIDVEGMEYQVLLGGDFSRFRPKVIVLEVTNPWSNLKSDMAGKIGQFLDEHGYCPVYFDGLNDYYIAREEKALRHALWIQPNVIDGYVTAHEHAALVDLAAQKAALAQERAERAREAERLKQDHAASVAELNKRFMDSQQEIALLQERAWRQTEKLQAAEARIRFFETRMQMTHQMKVWPVARLLWRVRRAVAALVRESARIVGLCSPRLYDVLAANRSARRVYEFLTWVRSPMPDMTANAPEALPGHVDRYQWPPSATAYLEGASPSFTKDSSFAALTNALRRWNLGKRDDA